MDKGEDEGEAHAVHKPERMYKAKNSAWMIFFKHEYSCLFRYLNKILKF